MQYVRFGNLSVKNLYLIVRMITNCILHVLARRLGGDVGSGDYAGKFKCQGVLLFRIIGQVPTVLAVCAGSCCLEIFPLFERQSDID